MDDFEVRMTLPQIYMILK